MNSKPRITRSSNVKNVIALEKSKQCIVRLEDFKRQQKSGATNSTTPPQSKAKPRIMVPTSTKKTFQKILPKPKTPQQQQHHTMVKKKQSHDDDLDSEIFSAFGRSRRTPKPNVKYFNDSVVTLKPGKKLKVDDDDDEEDDSQDDGDFEGEKEDEDASDFEISDEEEAPPVKKTRLTNTVVAQTARPNLASKSNVVVSKPNPATKQMVSIPATRLRNILPVQKMEVKKPTIIEKPVATPTSKKPMNIVTYTNTNNRTPITRKRPFETTPQSTQQKVNTPKTIANKAAPPQKAPAPKPNNVQQSIRPKPSTNVVTNNATGKSYTVLRRSTPAAVPSTPVAKREVPKKITPQPTLQPKKVTPQPTLQPKKVAPQPTSQPKKKPPEKKKQEEAEEDSANDSDNLEEDIGNPMALNTIDDFEAMPTFTIVNINDIINKKGDVLMEQTFPSDEKKPEEKQENTSKNRRKATHTVLKEEPNKSPPPKTPFPPIVKKTVAPTTTGQPLKQIVMNKKVMISPTKKFVAAQPAAPVVQKPPVRILNSTLCRQQPPVSPIIHSQKLQQQKPTPPQTVVKKEQMVARNESPQAVKKVLSPVKAAVNNNTISHRPLLAKKPIPTPPQAQKRKLPDEKVTVQRQGTKTIKKMTCFENWYVVHCPENQAPKFIPNQLLMPLIKIANTLQEICLPSQKWTTKVTLSLIPDMVYQRGQFEKYTGNYHDKAIVKDDQKHRYQPSSILFRRSQKPNAMDRTVILRNRTFLIYIQGKSVQLVGSPKVIRDLEDIESLLDCVDHLALDSDDVDITPSA